MRRQPRDALNLRPGVRLRVPRVPVVVLLLFPFPKVYSPRQLADDGEVDAAADGFFERRDGGEGVGGEVAGAEVAEGVHFFAELEEALFGADGARAVFLEMGKRGASVGCMKRGWCKNAMERREGEAYGATYCAQEDCVCFFGHTEGFICEGGTGRVDGGLGIAF